MRNLLLFLFLGISGHFFAQAPKLILPNGHAAEVYSAQFSPNGKKIVTASGDNSAKIWDANTGILLADLTEHSGAVKSAQFSPDGKKIVTASMDNTAKIWDANTGIIITTLAGHTSGITSALYSPDGKKIATVSRDKTIKIWDANTGILITTLKGHIDIINSAQFSPDGTKIVSASNDGTSKIWNAQSGILITEYIGKSSTLTNPGYPQLPFTRGAEFNSSQFNPDGNKIVTACGNNYAIIWDANTGKQIKYLSGYDYGVNTAFFSPDGTKIVTASGNDSEGEYFEYGAKIWDVNSGILITTLKGHTSGIISAQFSPNSKTIITVSWDETAKLWDANTGSLLSTLKSKSGAILTSQFSPNGEKVSTVLSDNSTKIWDAKSGINYTTLSGHTVVISDAQYSPDGTKIITASLHGMKVWDATSGILLTTLQGDSGVSRAKFSQDGTKIISTFNNNTAQLWDAITGTQIIFSRGSTYATQFSPDCNKLLIVDDNYKSKLYDVSTGKLIAELIDKPVIIPKNKTDDFNSPPSPPSPFVFHNPIGEPFDFFSPDGTKVITISSNKNLEVWDAITGHFILSINEQANDINSAQFSPDSKTIITTSKDKTAKIWDANNGTLIITLTGHTKAVNSAQFSSDGKKIVTVSKDNTSKIWDAKTGMLIATLTGQISAFAFPQFSPNGEIIISPYGDKLNIWDANTGILHSTLNGHTLGLFSAQFSPDGKKIVTTSIDNTAKVWDTETNQLIYTFIAIDNSDYMNLLPSGYYQCTSNAAKLFHYVTPDLKVITFEQLDVKYNRPDLFLKGIGNTNAALIESYHKAYLKRIQKLNIDTKSFNDGFSIPESGFREEPDYEQKQQKIRIHIWFSDKTYKIDRFNVWINESPLWGQKGISLKKRKQNNFDTIIEITLSDGQNRIETTMMNINGVESYRSPLFVNYTPDKVSTSKTYFIGIGVDHFKDSDYNLTWSSKDIRDMSIAMKKKYGTKVEIDTLFNENVTIENVKALKAKLKNTTINDRVIIAYSGHGLLSSSFDYYFSTYNVNFDKPEEGGLAYEELENLLDSIPARKKLLMIDACHSGEVDKEEMQRIAKVSNDTTLHLHRGPVIIYKPSAPKLGTKNSFELMNDLFVNVSKGTGATVIAASAGTQFALETNELQNGVFTFCFLQMLKSKQTCSVQELKKNISTEVERKTNGAQKPTSRSETSNFDWGVW